MNTKQEIRYILQRLSVDPNKFINPEIKEAANSITLSLDEAVQALLALVAEERKDEILDLLPKFVHPIGKDVIGYVSSIEAESAIRDRIAQLQQETEGQE